jgi:hypothetical protein
MSNARVGAIERVNGAERDELNRIADCVEETAQLIQHFISTKPIASVARQQQVGDRWENRAKN